MTAMKPLNKFGLTLLAVGVIVLAGFVLFEFFGDPNVPVAVRLGVVAVVTGVIVLIVSLARERIGNKEL
jgi:flagellar biosynthesis protein FliR